MPAVPARVVYIAASLDGFIAAPGGSVAWLDSFQQADYGYDRFSESVGTVVAGRTTYEQVLGFGEWPYAGKRTVVLTSRALDNGAPEKVEAWTGGAATLAAASADWDEGGRVWIMGGASVVAAFLDLGAVEEMELFVMPCLLGDGVRLFRRGRRPTHAALREATPYPNGVVRLRYVLGHPDRDGGTGPPNG